MANCERGCTIREQHLESCLGECWGCLPVHTEAVVCEKCQVRFDKSLTSILTVWPDLYKQLGKSKNYAFSDRVGGTPAVGLVLNENVVAVMDEVRGWLLFVMRVVITEDSGAPKDVTAEAIIRFIRLHQDFLMGHELASDLVEDAARLARKVENTAYPDGSRRVNIVDAECPDVVDGVKCGGRLFVVLQEVGARKSSTLYCRKSKAHKVEASNWIELGKKLRGLA